MYCSLYFSRILIFIFFPFQTEETKYVNGKFSSKIVIAPEENVTLTCIAENQLERTVTSLNVSASECSKDHFLIVSYKVPMLHIHMKSRSAQ